MGNISSSKSTISPDQGEISQMEMQFTYLPIKPINDLKYLIEDLNISFEGDEVMRNICSTFVEMNRSYETMKKAQKRLSWVMKWKNDYQENQGFIASFDWERFMVRSSDQTWKQVQVVLQWRKDYPTAEKLRKSYGCHEVATNDAITNAFQTKFSECCQKFHGLLHTQNLTKPDRAFATVNELIESHGKLEKIGKGLPLVLSLVRQWREDYPTAKSLLWLLICQR